MDDFTGFQFGEVHSSELGILVVSGGSRYNKDLLAPINDYTNSVDGQNGELFLGSTFDKRKFSVDIAYADVEEAQFTQMRRLFGDNKIKNLIFDEEPYKVYKAKVSDSPSFSFICFEENGKRIYKGEGKINFVAYYPFAISQFKYLANYRTDPRHYLNIDEWAIASRMREIKGSLDSFSTDRISLYNAGDIATDYILQFTINKDTTAVGITYGDAAFSLNLTKAPVITTSATIKIDSKKRLITHKVGDTETVINNCLSSGVVKPIPTGEATMIFSVTGVAISNVSIEYNYLYL